MADITFCSQTLCPNAKSCYRAQAKPESKWQGYATFRYTISTSGIDCEGYWPMFKSVATNSTVTGETNGSRT